MGTQGKGSVLAVKAVGTQCKGSVARAAERHPAAGGFVEVVLVRHCPDKKRRVGQRLLGAEPAHVLGREVGCRDGRA